MKFSSVEEAILRTYAGKSPALRSCRTHLSCERPPPFAHVEQCQHGVGAVGVLGQSAIARLGKTPEALEGQERMLDFGAHRGFSTIGLLIPIAKWPVLVGALVGEVLGLGRNLLESLALLLAPVGAVAIQARLLAMQQVGQLVTVVHVTRSQAGAVYQAAVTVYPDVQLHAKVPLIAFLALMHFRVAALLA